MSVENIRKLVQSAAVALMVALIFPALWLGITGESSGTPAVEKAFMEGMPAEQREAWIAGNTKREGFVKHIKSLPAVIAAHWRGYLETSAGLFIIIFVLNSAFLLGRRSNEP